MSDIFDEVEEDLRKDKAEELWRKYGKHVIALGVLIVASTAGYKGWQSFDASQNRELVNKFDSAVQLGREGNAQQAIDTLNALAADGGATYAALSRLQNAALMAKGGDREGASAIYLALEADTNVEELYRDLASVLYVMQEIDHADTQDLLTKIAPQTNDDKSWRYTARELGAVLAIRAGDNTLATDYLNRIIDDQAAPQSAKLRAQELLASIS
ncbi:MAG: tetratricopeptide repeat protein [Alphaproteobacteria bacterium]|nr:tetratricopeptide repeat protein [Alphaproteobacteria bacterium]